MIIISNVSKKLIAMATNLLNFKNAIKKLLNEIRQVNINITYHTVHNAHWWCQEGV